MKYIKKNKFKNTLHNFRGKYGDKIIINNDIMSNDYVYENNKFMFDILEEENKVIKSEVVTEEVVELEEEIISKEIVEPEEEVVELILNEKKTALEELEECSTVEQIHELANENGLDIDRRFKNIKKLKDDFKEELENKI